MSRRELEELLGIGHSTLKHWETGGQKMPHKRKQQLVDALTQRGFDCTVEWLENGTKRCPQWNESKKITAELDYFLSINKDSIGFILDNNNMSPIYLTGDAVGGIKHSDKNIDAVIEKYCIVELKNNHMMVCRLFPGSAPNHYNLEVLNSDISPDGRAVITDAELNFAAPIIWHRSVTQA